MVKADNHRSALLDRLADHMLAEGMAGSSLRPLARAAGLSDRMLLYYFKDKSEIVTAALERISLRFVALLDGRTAQVSMPLAELRAVLMPVLLDDAFWPYMRLWLEVAAMAGQGDAFCRATGEQIARGFLVWGAAQLDAATPAERAADAVRLLIMTEGMVLLKSIGLEAECRAVL